MKFPHLYAVTNRLSNLADDEVGKWVEILEEEFAKLPATLTKTLDDPFFMGGHYLMLRKEMQDVLEALREIKNGADENATGKSIGVFGPRGSGKTCLLNLVSLYAIQNDWLLFATNGEEFPRDIQGFITPSETRPGIFNQDRNAVAFFKHHMETQGNKLKQIKLKRDYDYAWMDRNAAAGDFDDKDAPPAPAPTDLWGLLDQAVLQPAIATHVFYDLVEELKLSTEVPVLVTIDNLNAWDQQSLFRRPDNAFKTIKARELSMVDAWSTFQTQGPGNGLSVFALTQHATLNMSRVHMEGADFALETSIYSDDELKHAVQHYKVGELINSEVDSFLLARTKGLTGGVPRDAFFDAAMI